LNRQPATPLSDLFSVGILLHEMLTLRHPFGEPKDLLDYLERMQTAKAPTLTEIPLELAETVRRALQPDPSVRFESPEALAKSLALFLARAGRPAGPAELAHFLQGLNLAEPLSANAGAGPLASTFVRGFSLHAASKAGFPLDNDWKTTGPSLDASGRLTREPPRIEPAPGALGTPPPRPEPVLELAAAPARTTVVARTQNVQFGKPVNAAPGPGPRRTPWLALLAAVGLGAAGVLYGPKLWKEARGWVKAPTGALTAAPILSIDSEPSGAQVTINKKVIGTTPLFRENDFPDAPVEVMVSASGYRPWRGTFRGGKTAQLKAKLIRRGR
ncbi:MAG TPA: PEGA domain-containing protein, partial [Myxococcaceae bacterium]|nr:PEGA domain-containing protein [Myxococcaceae bacterium]